MGDFKYREEEANDALEGWKDTGWECGRPLIVELVLGRVMGGG